MEHTLRCNALKCRKEVKDRAVVTTCSHIFCLECAEQLQVSSPPPGQRPICPACDAHLTNPDDAVITNLNPTEDYKTSVLSGLSPTIIMECAGRSLSFWTYQTSQEVIYQVYLAKSLAEKYTGLNSQMDKVVHEANSLISDLRNKMNNMSVDHESLRGKNEELLQSLRDKNKKYLQTQELYDKLKRRAMMGQVQNAATDDAVDYTLQASAAANNRYVDHMNKIDQRPLQQALFSGSNNGPMQRSRVEVSHVPMMPPPVARPSGAEAWNSFNIQESIYRKFLILTVRDFGETNDTSDHDPAQTPSNHRQRLTSGVGIGISGLQPGRSSSTPSQRETPIRQPSSTFSPNGIASRNGLSGYGMSAGLKVSHQQAATPNDNILARPTIRSRVAHRQSPVLNSGHINGYY